MTYTQLGVVAVIATVLLDVVVLRTRLLTRRAFWVAYAIVVFFQLVTNGLLTGFRIVRYDGAAIIGSDTGHFLGHGRVVWAPVEDLMFGFALVVTSMVLWVWWGRRGIQATPLAGPPRGVFAGLRRPGPQGSAPGRKGHRDPT